MDDNSAPKEPVTVVRRKVNVAQTPAKVHRVIIDGVARTKDDIVTKQMEPLMDTENFLQLLMGCADAKHKLDALGIFKSIKVKVDTSKVPGSRPDAYDVHFDVTEKNLLKGGLQTQFDANSANMQYSVGLPNVFGRAEKLMAEYTYGTKKRRGLGLHFTKPMYGNLDVMLGANAYQAHTEYLNNGFKETNRGVSADLSFPSLLGTHNIKWEGVWRDLRCLSNTTSFAVREQAGHSLKSSLIHTLIRDSRDDPLLPTEGTLFKLTQEYAGLGGNAKFFKSDVEFQASKSLVFESVVQLSLAAGVVRPLQPNKEIMLNDRFFIGGPLNLRGFNVKGVGPHSEGDVLGGDAYCLGALHLYTPLPFRPSATGFWDLFRTHLFVNAGNCGRVQDFNFDQLNRNNFEVFKNSVRLAYGAGLVLRLGIARLELNYSVPVWAQKGDSAQHGVQLGIGITFL